MEVQNEHDEAICRMNELTYTEFLGLIKEELLEFGNLFSGSWISASVP